MSKDGHPLPANEEAKLNRVPEEAKKEKGFGGPSRPGERSESVRPDGSPYPTVSDRAPNAER